MTLNVTELRPRPTLLRTGMNIPEGWTDDMSIALPPGLAVERVANMILDRELAGQDVDGTLAELVVLGLSADDAELAHDRAMGGVVRASTGNPANAPPRLEDPVAWASYQRCLREPRIIATLRPPIVPAAVPTAANPPHRPGLLKSLLRLFSDRK